MRNWVSKFEKGVEEEAAAAEETAGAEETAALALEPDWAATAAMREAKATEARILMVLGIRSALLSV